MGPLPNHSHLVQAFRIAETCGRVTLLLSSTLKRSISCPIPSLSANASIPHNHIALVEPYAPLENPRVQTTREFFGRVVLINRDSILIGERPEDFAKAHGLRMIEDDKVAVNPAVHFRVETFLPTEGFTPAKAYMTRLLWRDLDGNEQSKLLLTEPEAVLGIAVTGVGGLVATSGRGRGGMTRCRRRQPMSQALYP